MHQEIMAWFVGIPIGWLLIFILWFAIWAPLVAILEYGVHRWIMHKASRVLDPQLDHLKSHAAHHGGSNTGEFVDVPLVDCVLLTSPAFILLSAWGLAVGPFSAVVIPAAALLAWCFLYAYLWTRIHRAIHGAEANWFRRCGRVFRFFREHHFKHHANAKVNYGAVFPWTDYLFLTSSGPTVDRLRGDAAARAPQPPLATNRGDAMKLLMAIAIALLFSAAAQAQALQTCYKSKWGPNDQIGALNHITADNVLAASKLVKRGKAIRMGIETNSKTPAFPPRTFSVTILTPGQEYGGTLGDTKTNYNDDIIMGWVGIGSQLDGLGHIGIDGVYYNCSNGREFVSAAGLKKFGIETVPAIATRAVILDMVGLTGQDPVREGTAFNRKEIDAALQRQGNMRINRGDVVIFYTGWTKLIGKDDKRYGSVEPGLGIEGAHYLASLNVAMVGADTWGLEVLPFEDPKKIFHVHQILIPQNGIMILENVNAEDAVKDRVYEGLFTLGPSRVTGAVQAIINPIFLY